MDSNGVSAYALTTPEYLQHRRVEQPWVIEPILPVGGSALIFGAPKAGKSYLALQMAAAITGETDEWLGFAACQRGVVLFVEVDVGKTMWQDQHCSILAEAGYPLEAVYHADRDMIPWPFDILQEECQAALRYLVATVKPLVVFIDTIRKIHTGDENDSGHMKEVTVAVQDCSSPAAVVYVGHSRKPKEDSGNDVRNEMRGSNYMTGEMDCNIQCLWRGKAMELAGRAVEDQRITTQRTPYLWERNEVDEQFKAQLACVMQDRTLVTARAKARELTRVSRKPEETCRSAVRRAMEVLGRGISQW